MEFPVKFGTFCSRLRLKITKIFLSNMAFLTSEECSSVFSKPRKIIKKEIVSKIFNFENFFFEIVPKLGLSTFKSCDIKIGFKISAISDLVMFV